MKSPKRYIFIAGYGRSGSTALDVSLTRSANAIGVGEARYLVKDILRRRNCACGVSLDDCKFWGKFVRKVNSKPSFVRYFYFLAKYRAFISNSVKERNVDVIVDSSKSTLGSALWILMLLTHLRSELFVIHLTRDWSEVRKSVRRGSNEHLQFGKKNKRFRVLRAFIMYRVSNIFAAWLLKFLPGKRVFFSDFKRDQNSFVESIWTELGINSSFYSGNETSCHQVAGNRTKFKK